MKCVSRISKSQPCIIKLCETEALPINLDHLLHIKVMLRSPWKYGLKYRSC